MVVFPTRTRAERSTPGGAPVETIPPAAAVAAPSRRLPLLVAGGLAVLAVGLCLIATRDGVGVSRDSAVYLGSAESLADGDGLTVPFRPYPLSADAAPLETRERLDNFPPLYPALLAGLSRATGLEARTVARGMNVVLLAVLVLVVYGVLFLASGRRLAVAAVVAVLTALSPDVLTTASMAWTELLFTVLAVLALVCVALHLRVPRPWTLWAAVALIALACLTRWAGGALVLGAAASLLLLSQQSRRTRMREAAIVAVVGILPVLVWMGATAAASDGLANRQFAVHPIGNDAVTRASETAVAWLVPAHGQPEDSGPIAAVVDAVAGLPLALRALMALAVIAVFAGLARRGRATPGGQDISPALGSLVPVLLLFLAAYLAFLVLASSVLDASLARFDHRILMPAHVAALLAAGLIVQQRVDLRRDWLPAVAVAVPVVALLGASTVLALRGGDRFAGVYAAEGWRRSPIMTAIRELPAGRPVVTNEPNGVWAVTGRSTAPVPEQKSVVTLEPNRDLEADLVTLGEAMRRDGAVLVYVDDAGESPFPASEATLLDTLPLRLVRGEADGRVYEIDCPPAATHAVC